MKVSVYLCVDTNSRYIQFKSKMRVQIGFEQYLMSYTVGGRRVDVILELNTVHPCCVVTSCSYLSLQTSSSVSE